MIDQENLFKNCQTRKKANAEENFEKKYIYISRYLSFIDKIRLSGVSRYFKVATEESIGSYMEMYRQIKEKFKKITLKEIVENPGIIKSISLQMQLGDNNSIFTEKQIFGFTANFFKNFYLKSMCEMVMIEDTLALHYNFSNLGVGAKFLVANPDTQLITDIISYLIEGAVFGLKYTYSSTPDLSLDFSFNKLKKFGMGPFKQFLEKDLIFRVKFLNFTRCSLGNEGVNVLSKHLTNSKFLSHLILKSNEISDLGVKSLSESIIKHPALQELDLSNNEISNSGANYIANIIQNNNILKKINLFNNSISCGKCFFEALVKNPQNVLEYLNLGINLIGQEGVKILSKFLSMKSPMRNDKRMSYSEHFSISTEESKNFVSMDGGIDFFNFGGTLGTISNNSQGPSDTSNGLFTLISNDNDINESFSLNLFNCDEERESYYKNEYFENEFNIQFNNHFNGEKENCKSRRGSTLTNLESKSTQLAQSPKKPRRIEMSHNESNLSNNIFLNSNELPPLDNRPPKIISPLLYKNFPKIKYINLSKNNLSDFEILYLSTALKENYNLENLILSQNNLTHQSSKFLAENISQNDHSGLKNINLSENLISGEGLRYLSQMLIKNTSIESLILANNKIHGYDGLTYLSECLSKNRTLKTLELQYNELGNVGCFHIANGMKLNTQLKTLNLFSNKIAREGAKLLAQAIYMNKLSNLTSLFMGCNQLGDKGAGYFTYLFAANNMISTNQLQVLDLSQNKIGFHGAKFIADALLTNDSLIVLDLKDNEINCDGVNFILNSFNKNYIIKKINLNNNFSRSMNFIFTKK